MYACTRVHLYGLHCRQQVSRCDGSVVRPSGAVMSIECPSLSLAVPYVEQPDEHTKLAGRVEGVGLTLAHGWACLKGDPDTRVQVRMQVKGQHLQEGLPEGRGAQHVGVDSICAPWGHPNSIGRVDACCAAQRGGWAAYGWDTAGVLACITMEVCATGGPLVLCSCTRALHARVGQCASL